MYLHTGRQNKDKTQVHRQKQQPQQQLLVVSRQPDIQTAGLFWSKWRYGRCIETEELSRVFCGGSKTRMNAQVEWSTKFNINGVETDPFSHNHGSVEHYPKWKETTIGDTPIFHWAMNMGGRLVLVSREKNNRYDSHGLERCWWISSPTHYFWLRKGFWFRLEESFRHVYTQYQIYTYILYNIEIYWNTTNIHHQPIQYIWYLYVRIQYF